MASVLWFKRELCRNSGHGLYPSFQVLRRMDTAEELKDRTDDGQEASLAHYGVRGPLEVLALHIVVRGRGGGRGSSQGACLGAVDCRLEGSSSWGGGL